MQKRYNHLGQDERYQIFAWLAVGLSQAEIARKLGCSQSTISRELKRNGLKYHRYRPKEAEYRAKRRISKANRRNATSIDDALWELVKQKLTEEQWSPQQIAGWLKRHGKGSISHESIYRRIIADRLQGGQLYLSLRRKQKKYNKRQGKQAGRGLIKDPMCITQRPKRIEERKTFGHWEADTVIGTQIKGKVLVTLVERKSRLTLIGVAENKSAASVSAVMINLLTPFIGGGVRTITCDNGKEFANHKWVDQQLGCQTYFAKPYHSWERGTNENTNGLIRQYFPKGQSLNHVTDSDAAEVAAKLNTRPRKIHSYRTPLEAGKQALSYLNIDTEKVSCMTKS